MKLALKDGANLDEDLNQFLRKHFACSEHNFFALYSTKSAIEKTKNLIAKTYNLNTAQICITKDTNLGLINTIKRFYSFDRLNLSFFPEYKLFYYYIKEVLDQDNIKFIQLKIKDNQFIPSENILDIVKSIKPRLVYLSFPNSYCGYKISLAEIKKICEFAVDGYVIIDEVFYEYLLESCSSLLPFYKNLIVLRSFSKTHGLCGLRIGCVIAHPEIISQIKKVSLYCNPTGMALEALSHLLESGQEILKKSIQNNKTGLKTLIKFFIQNHCEIMTTQANFILVKKDYKNSTLKKFLKQVSVMDFSVDNLYRQYIGPYYRISSAPKKLLQPILSAI